MQEQSREAHFARAGFVTHAFDGIAFQVERAVKGFRAGPDPTGLRKSRE